MTLSEFQLALGIDKAPPLWEEIFEDVSNHQKALAKILFDIERISDIIEEYKVLTAYRSEILQAAQELSRDDVASLYLSLTERAMQLEKLSAMPIMMLYPDTVGGRFSLLFPLLSSIPRNVAYLRSRGIDEEMIEGTLYEFDRAIEVYAARSGGIHALPVSSFYWLQLFYENRLVRMGRLNFELRYDFIGQLKAFRNRAGDIKLMSHELSIHNSGRPLGAALCTDEEGSFYAAVEETETEYIGNPLDPNGRTLPQKEHLSKSEWSLALEFGDKVIAVHIPTGGSLDSASCEASYALARKTFARCFPEFDYKAFSCVSWLMDRQLAALSKPGANIVAFLQKYIPFQRSAPGTDVFPFVFMTHPGANIAMIDHTTLPEDTGLRRAIKAHYINHGRIYEDGGIFF